MVSENLSEPLDDLCDLLIEKYNIAVAKALNHQGILEELDFFAEAMPRLDVSIDLDAHAWWQFGVPRLRAVVDKLTFLPSWDTVNVGLSRMGRGEICSKRCKLCFTK